MHGCHQYDIFFHLIYTMEADYEKNDKPSKQTVKVCMPHKELLHEVYHCSVPSYRGQ